MSRYDPQKPITASNHPIGFRFPPLRRQLQIEKPAQIEEKTAADEKPKPMSLMDCFSFS